MTLKAIDPITGNLKLLLTVVMGEELYEANPQLLKKLLEWGAEIAHYYIHAVDSKGQPMITDEEIDQRFEVKKDEA